ncbi:MAG: hypothetical protein K1X92_16560, partial [Bacteroidia bacterium]|nr:hypothetical protein [Bacteroidia bacterium]
LESCKKEAVNYPILRETITQYIHLLKFLTNQTTNQIMNNEIVDGIFASEEKLNAYLELISNTGVKHDVYNRIYAKFKTDLEEVASRLNLQLLEFDFKREKKPFSIFSFSNETFKQFNLKIAYCFQEKNMQNLVFGLCYITYPNNRNIPKEFKEQFDKMLGFISNESDWFLCYKEHNYRNWGPVNHARANDGTIAKYIEEELNSMLKIFKEVGIK